MPVKLGGGVFVFVDVVVAGGTSTGIDAGWDVIAGVGAFCLRNLLYKHSTELMYMYREFEGLFI